MLLTASKMAACSMAKLRVECIVGGWAPSVRTITSRVLFHSMTGFTDCEAESAWSSSLVTVMLANPVTGLKRPAHRTANAKILFTIRFPAPIGFSERRQSPGRTTDLSWSVESHAIETQRGKSLFQHSAGLHRLTELAVMAARSYHRTDRFEARDERKFVARRSVRYSRCLRHSLSQA